MKKTLLAVAALASAVLVGLNVTGLIRADNGYDPLFNTFTNVSGIGDEKDFLRVQNDDGTRVNTKEICSGETRLWIYVHNNRPSANNDDPNKVGEWDGVGVAKNTRVKLSLPGTFTNSTTASASVSADNAVATATDTAFMTCGGKKVKVEYVAVEAVNSNPQGNFTLSGDIMSANGASLNYKGMTGVVPGCYEYRASIVVKVKITPEPEQPKPQSLECKVLVNRNGLGLGVALEAVTVNVTPKTYKIDFGDGTVVNTQTATHVYTTYGPHKVTGTVTGTGLDGKTLTANCYYEFTENAPAQSLQCKLLVNREGLGLGVALQAIVTNVTPKTYKIDFGDGTVVNTQTATHVYTTYGDHKVVGTVTGTGVDGKTLTATCEYSFNEPTPEKPPVTPPTPPEPPVVPPVTPPVVPPVTPPTPPTPNPELPNTGAGSVLGLVSGVTLLGAAGHRMWTVRRMQ